MNNNQTQFRVSPSSLNLFLECPRCFWLYKAKGIHRPEGPMSSLPMGMDNLLKKYFDRYRAENKVPPEIEGKVEGKPFEDQKLLDKWRDWRSSDLIYQDKELNGILMGALDECFVSNGAYIPVDFKTRGFALKEDSVTYYQNQLNCYTLMLEANGFKHPSFGYLIFYIPREIKEDGMVWFSVEPVKVPTDTGAARELFEKAVRVLQGPIPSSSPECKFCSWAKIL